jgi:hypothetical protein
LLGTFVISGESVDSGFNHNEPVFGVSILSVFLKVLSDTQSLFDKAVEVFWDLRSASCFPLNFKVNPHTKSIPKTIKNFRFSAYRSS